MAEIRRRDIIEEKAIKAPLELAENLKVATDELKEFLSLRKKASVDIGGADSTKKVREEVEKLTEAEKLLQKISKQIADEELKKNAVYQQQLDKLNNLKKAAKERNTISSEEARLTNALTSSLVKLDQALKKNREDYAKLTSEEQRNSKAGRELLRTIQEQDKASKEISKSMGQHQKEVGNYGMKFAEAEKGLQQFGGSIGGVIGNVRSLGKELGALLTNGYFLAIAAIILLFKTLDESINVFYTSTARGQEQLKEQQLIWDGFFARLKKGFGESVGAAATFWENLKENFILGHLELFSKAMAEQFKKDVANARALAKELSAIEKEHMRDIVDDARTEQMINELLEDSKDKLHKTDIERLTALREARKLSREQADGDIKLAERDLAAQQKVIENLGGRINRQKSLAEYTDDEFRALGANQEQIKKLVDLEAALYKVKADAAAKAKNFNKQEFQLVEDIRKAQEDRIFRAEEGERKYRNTQLQGYIKARDILINQETTDLAERLKLLQENVDDRAEILENEKNSQLAILKRAAEERIRGEGRLVNDKILENDKGFVKERLAIVEGYNQSVEQLARYNVDTLTAIYMSEFKRRNDAEGEAYRERVRIINEGFNAGIFTLNQYHRALDEENQKFQNDQLNDEVAYLTKVIDARKKAGLETLEFEKLLAKVRYDNEYQKAKELEKLEAETASKRTQIRAAAFEFVNTLGDRYFSLQTDRLDAELENLRDNLDKQLKAAGDNEKAKERIQAEYDRKEREIEKEKRRLQRQQAIFEKTIAVAQATINTAVAVTKNIAFPPLAIATAALGALEIATILATPIPAAEKGTDYHKGGLIRVSEKGPELMILPSGRELLTPAHDSIINAPRGAKIVNHEETMRRLARTAIVPETIGTREDAALNRELLAEMRQVNNTLQTRRSTFVSDGAALVETIKESETSYKKIRHTNLGGWIK